MRVVGLYPRPKRIHGDGTPANQLSLVSLISTGKPVGVISALQVVERTAR